MTQVIDLTGYRLERLICRDDSDKRVPRVLTVAGSDSSGGAGIEADLKTFAAHNCYGMTCINSLTAQNTEGVVDAFELPYAFVRDILEANFKDIEVDVIKTGMLSENGIKALVDMIEKYNFNGKLVVDPVMISTSGFELSKKSNLELLLNHLAPRATLITPNLSEAKTILSLVDSDSFDTKEKAAEYYMKLEITDEAQVIELCRKITKKSFIKNILIKGGHVKYAGNKLIDTLYQPGTDEATFFQSTHSDSTSTHGTGCTLASAIAANLGKGLNLVDSVGNGILFVQKAINMADTTIGNGNGPLNHFGAHEPIKFQPIDYKQGDLMEFLKNHRFIKKDWERFTHHSFVKKLSSLELPLERYYDFLKQDHIYLFNYAKTHCLAGSVAPSPDDLEKETDVLSNIFTEMKKHRKKVLDLGVPSEELDKVKANKASKEYTDYLLKIAKNGTWLEINIAMSACLFGYREAGLYGMSLWNPEKDTDTQKYQLYKEWLDDYCSEWYGNACAENELLIRKCKFTTADLVQLLEIFSNVVKLEIKFWDAYV